MAQTRIIQRAFVGGEVSPQMLGRSDDVKYKHGLRSCRNFIVNPQGPAQKRPGFKFVRSAKFSLGDTRLIPFTFNVDQTMVLEFGAEYIRFHTNGATLMNGDAPYEIATPYAALHLFELQYVQSADVMTIVHPSYPPAELRRLGPLNWEYVAISFTPSLSPPTNTTATANGHTHAYYLYHYVVTAVADDGGWESNISNVASDNGNLLEQGGTVSITWDAVTGADRYNVYKEQGGVYGYMGSTVGTSMTDDNISPDMTYTIPYYDQALSTDYPGAVCYFEQRRVFAGTASKPQNLWATRSGTESIMSYSLPLRDDDRIAIRIAANQVNKIRHLVALSDLIAMTDGAEWRISSSNDALSPRSISVKAQSYIGASAVTPIVVGTTVLFAAGRGGHLHEMAYSWEASGFVVGDLSLRAPHLFDGFDIKDTAYAKTPTPIIWVVSTNGELLGLTYIPQEQVGAWHRHTTQGIFESCCTVAEGDVDALYVVVQRLIDGVSQKYIERLEQPREFSSSSFYVDSGLEYQGIAATTISGLDHLDGAEVAILVDGATHPNRTVENGAITLDYAGQFVSVGLPYESEIQTLPFAQETDGSLGQGRKKNVNRVWLRVENTSGIWVGPDDANLVEHKQRTRENYGLPPNHVSKEIEVVLNPLWARDGSVVVKSLDPLPMEIVSIAAELALGD